MNSVLNTLVRAIGRAVLARPRARLAAAAIVVLAAGTGLWQAAGGAYAEGSLPRGGFPLSGRVVQVNDGDTLTLLVRGRQERVRLASIDAPEITRERRPGQPYAQASREALADLVAGKTLTLHCYERDRYERSICDVPLGGGDTANRRQVAAGMAWANMEGGGKFMRDGSLPGLQDRARSQGLGLWRDRKPVQPWAWRYHCWKKQQC